MRIRYILVLVVVLIAANILLYRDLFSPAVLSVQVLSVGKGDATLVRTPSGKTLLIDTGPDASILRALGSALPFWQRSIDVVVLTSSAHASSGGLSEVTDRYHVGDLMRLSTTEEHLSLGEDISATVLASPKGFARINISYGSTMLTISSSTPVGVYTSDGKTVTTK